MFEIAVSYAISRKGVPSALSFKRWASAALDGRGETAELAIHLVDAEQGRTLNHEYRHKDYATNVLSFPAECPPGLPEDIAFPELGDLIICAPVVAREAQEQGKSLNAHYAHLTIHGVLHLLGFDHEDESEAEVMEQRERDILAQLGIEDPYAAL